MSCYFRNLKDVFAEAGIEVNAGNKKQLDRVIHQIAAVDYKDCPNTWRKVKQDIMSDPQKRQEFIDKLKKAMT